MGSNYYIFKSSRINKTYIIVHNDLLLLFAWASDLSIQVIEDGIRTGHLPIRCQSLINALSTWYIFWVSWKLIRLRRTEFQDAKTPWHFSKSKTLILIKGIQSALFIPTWWTNVLSYYLYLTFGHMVSPIKHGPVQYKFIGYGWT